MSVSEGGCTPVSPCFHLSVQLVCKRLAGCQQTYHHIRSIPVDTNEPRVQGARSRVQRTGKVVRALTCYQSGLVSIPRRHM